jgi:D-serine deaminase-like pyridoxal phosphate-dependent protein
MTLADIQTPAVAVDRGRLFANLDAMQADAAAHGVRVRPHAKTHKSPAVAAWQIARGAVGVCCAKVGEAEVFSDAGVEDIRIPYPVNPDNAERILALMRRCRLSIIVDHPVVARRWSSAMTAAGATLDVLVKVDVGFHRCGIDPTGPTAVEFVRLVSALPGLGLRGLLSHAGHAYHAASEDHLAAIAHAERDCLIELAERAAQVGVEIGEVSVGSTPTARFSLKEPGITELRAGNYAYRDRTQVGLGSATLEQCALTIVATVVSKPSPGRLVLDSGSKTLSTDGARGFTPLEGYGLVFSDLEANVPDPSLVVARLSEEHGVVTVDGGVSRLEPGDRVRVLPNHSCVVSNLVDHVYLVDGLRVVDRLPIAARGRIT